MESMNDIICRKDRMDIPNTILAQTAGMSEPQLSILLDLNKNPRQDTLMRLSAALDTIEQNKFAIANGVIILNEVNLRNSLYNAMVPILLKKEPLIMELVESIYIKLTLIEE